MISVHKEGEMMFSVDDSKKYLCILIRIAMLFVAMSLVVIIFGFLIRVTILPYIEKSNQESLERQEREARRRTNHVLMH